MNQIDPNDPTIQGILIGLCFGFPAGMLFVWVQLAWRSVRGAKQLTAAAQHTAWSRVRQSVVFVGLIAVGVAFAIGRFRR